MSDRQKSWRPVRCKRWPLFQHGSYHIASCVCFSARDQKPTTRRAPSPSGRPKPGPVLDSLDRLKGLGPKSNHDAARRFRTTRPCSGPGVVGAGTNGRQQLTSKSTDSECTCFAKLRQLSTSTSNCSRLTRSGGPASFATEVHGSYVAHGAVDNANAATGTTAFERKRKRQPFHVASSETVM